VKHVLVIRCLAGHEQTITYDDRFSRDEVQAHAAIMCGGVIPGLELEMPGHPCAWDDSPPEEHRPCGAKVFFTIEEVTS